MFHLTATTPITDTAIVTTATAATTSNTSCCSMGPGGKKVV